MIFTILIVLLSLVLLTALHELGHFIFAKKFGVQVQEFGVCYPPRIIGKKIKGTIYSFNLLPFGAFVKIKGEEGDNSQDKDSFSQKPKWQRAIILLAGVLMFWVVAFLIFTILAGFFGQPTAIADDIESATAQVQVMAVSTGSPAATAGIEVGDIIKQLKAQNLSAARQDEKLKIEKTSQLQELVQQNAGKEIILFLSRNGKDIEVKITPRANPPQGQGAMGVGLIRVDNIKTNWYKAPYHGAVLTLKITKAIPVGLYNVIKMKIEGEKITGIEFMGPIGIGQALGRSLSVGWGSFLGLIGMIAIWLAIFNLLPIPALDGGRLLFLAVEAIRRKPMNQKIEQNINSYFFLVLIALMLLLSLRDIVKLF